MIAGGIGITPIRSLMEEMLSKGKDVVLVYANRNQQVTVFAEELESLRQKYNARIIQVMSDQADFPGEKGKLDKEKIQRLVPDFLSREIYLCGPPPMMESIIGQLKELSFPHSLIHYEKFSLG
jgi:ferredoxin-NADP reductase